MLTDSSGEERKGIWYLSDPDHRLIIIPPWWCTIESLWYAREKVYCETIRDLMLAGF